MTEFLQPLQVGYANSKPQALYKTPGSFSSNIELIRYSAYTPWLFPVSDLKDIVGLGYFFGVLSVLQGPFLGFKNDTRPWDLICRTSLMLIWSWTQLLTFNLQYQRNPKGIAEDAINKPWRPIPSGRISRYAASCLLYCAFPAQVIYSYYVGGLGPCLVELFFSVLYNDFSGDANPLIRNLLNAIGIGCFYAGPVETHTATPPFSPRPRHFVG